MSPWFAKRRRGAASMRHSRRIDYGLQRFLLNHVSVQAMEAKGLSASYGLMAPILVTFGLGIFVSHARLGIFDSNAMQLRNAFAFSAIRLSADLNISLLRFIFFLLGIVINDRGKQNLRLVCNLESGEKLAIWGSPDVRGNMDAVVEAGLPCTVECKWISPKPEMAEKFGHTYWVPQHYSLRIVYAT